MTPDAPVHLVVERQPTISEERPYDPIVEAHGLLASVERGKIRFISGDTECAAWHYPEPMAAV